MVYLGTVLFPFFFNGSIKVPLKIKYFLLLFQVFFVVCFVAFVYYDLEVEDYIKCELINGGKHHIFQNFSPLIVAVHNTHQYILCIVAIVDCTQVTMISITKQSDLVAIVDCIHIGSTTASFEDLVTFHSRTQKHILVEDQLWPPLDIVTSENCTN